VYHSCCTHHKAATITITMSATMRTPAAAPATAPGDTELLLKPVPVESDQQYYYLCFKDRMTQWVGAIVTCHPLPCTTLTILLCIVVTLGNQYTLFNYERKYFTDSPLSEKKCYYLLCTVSILTSIIVPVEKVAWQVYCPPWDVCTGVNSNVLM